MKMLQLGLILFCILSFNVIALDQFEEYTLSQKINEMPDRIISECRAEIQATLESVEDKVDARLYSLPVLVYASSAVGAIVGGVMVMIMFLFVTGPRARLLAAQNKELILLLRAKAPPAPKMEKVD